MSAGLVIVRKEMGGEEFSNTYGIMLGTDSVPLTEADLAAMVDQATLGADQVLNPATAKVVNAIIDFEMALMFNVVNFLNIYITDGRNTTAGGDPTTIFYSKNLSIKGNRAVADTDAIVPGSVTLMANRIPGGFSTRQGRAFYRGVLSDGEVSYKGPKLVGWGPGTSQSTVNTLFETALTDSGLRTHFAGSTNVAGGILAIPHYQKATVPPAITDGNLIGATPMVDFNCARPVSRQVARGRKEK